MAKFKNDEDKIDHIKKRSEYFEERYGACRKAQMNDFEFYRGEQWKKTKKKEWQDAGMPTNTNNRVKGKVNLMKGEQAENRFYFKVIPNDDYDAQTPVLYEGQSLPIDEVCRRITAEMKKIENENDGEYELSECFGDGVTCGTAYLEPYIKERLTSFPPKKYIVFEKRSYKECYPDPDAKRYDLSDAKDWFKFLEVSKDDLKVLFPNKAKEIDGLKREVKLLEDFKDEIVSRDKYQQDQATTSSGKHKEFELLILKEYYYFKNEEETYVLSTTLQQPQRIPNDKETVITEMYEKQKAESMMQGIPFDYRIFKKQKQTWYVCATCCDELLGEQEMPIDEITCVPYYADMVSTIDELDKRVIGIVRDLKSPQDAYNRLDSLTLAHTGSSVHSGIVAEEGALVNKNKWKQFLSMPGFIGEVAKGAIKKWQQIFPNALPQGFFTLGKDKAQEMDEISNVRPDLMGANKDEQSGKALAMTLNQGHKGIHFYFDNFRRTKHILARKLVKLICYLRDVDFDMLKIVIDDATESPTTRWANYLEQRNLLETGALDSPYGDLIIQGTNLTNKDLWVQRWSEVQEFMRWKQEMEMKREAEQMAIEDARKEGLIPKNPMQGAAA